MLVLTRKDGQSIQITTPDNHVINIMITRAEHGKAKIGIDAPAYYSVMREELLEKPVI